MVAGGKQLRIDGDFDQTRPLRLARRYDDLWHRRFAEMVRPEAARPRHMRLDLALRPDSGNLLLIARAFGKHAEFQHGPRAGGEVDDHIGIVPDVGALTVIDLVQMVHRLASRGHDADGIGLEDEAHEIEEMAAFLDQRSAGVAVEAVPVADLFEERKAVLADGQHPDAAGRGLRLFRQPRDGRHVAIFHCHPDRRGIGGAQCRQTRRVGRIGKERLFAQNGHGRIDAISSSWSRCM